MARNRVYVARKECGCIVAAFPVLMDKAIKGKLLEQFAKAGYDIEQTSEIDVQANFALSCDHNKPPLLAYLDSRTKEGQATGMAEEIGIATEEGVDQEDIDAAASEATPEAEEADETMSPDEEKPVDHQEAADDLLNNFLEEKKGQEEDDDDESTDN